MMTMMMLVMGEQRARTTVLACCTELHARACSAPLSWGHPQQVHAWAVPPPGPSPLQLPQPPSVNNATAGYVVAIAPGPYLDGCTR